MSRPLAESMRALKTKWRHGRGPQLDLDRTVEQYAVTKILVPLTKPVPERWFEVHLVTDRSGAGPLWAEEIEGFAGLLRDLGAFRAIRRWILSYEAGIPHLLDRAGQRRAVDRLRSVDHRRLVFVASDFTGDMWYGDKSWKAVRLWAESAATVLVELLPAKLRHITTVYGPTTTARPGLPGSANSGLVVRRRENDSRYLPMPLLTLTPASLRRWADMLMRGDPAGCPTILLPGEGPPFTSEVLAQREAVEALEGVRLLELFDLVASRNARRIATLATALSGINITVLRFIAQRMVPGATASDVAEVVVSNLFRRSPTDDDVLTFRPDVREAMQRRLMRPDVWRVLDALEQYVTQHSASPQRFSEHAAVLPFVEASHSVRTMLSVETGGQVVEVKRRTPAPARVRDANPDEVHTLSELAAAFQLLRGTRSYRELQKAASLPKSTVSDLLTGKSVPTRKTVEAFVSACGLDEQEHGRWLAAWERVDGHLRRPAGSVRVREARAQSLGVHAAIHIPGAAGNLPVYVPRDFDADLRIALTTAAGEGGFVLLVGSSSVGKTRSLFEAVQAVLAQWWLLHPDPADPQAMWAFAAAPAPRTVLWLDELQNYLGNDALTAAAARALIGAGVVLVGTLWPHEYAGRIAPRTPGQPDLHAADRELLRLAQVLTVPEQFSSAERRRAQALAAGDERIRIAVDTPDAGVTQVLAAGPELLRWWQQAPAEQCYGKAVITAAVDARRVGATAPLTHDFLQAAAPSYLDPAQQATSPPDWLDQALTYATTALLGATSALTPVPAGTGRIAGYTVADYLYQYARRTVQLPDAVWQALVNYHHPDDTLRLAESARHSARTPHAVRLYRQAADAGDATAAERLLELLADQGEMPAITAGVAATSNRNGSSAVIVGVPGIAQHLRGRHALIAAWAPSLADGLERATGRRVAVPQLDVAFYGDVFMPGQEGGATKSTPVESLLDGVDDQEMAELGEALSEAVGADDTAAAQQGVPKHQARMPLPVHALRAVGRRFGASATELYVGALRPVHRYLRDPHIKTAVDARVAQAVGSECQVLIGHSLGSVVAYEYLRQHPGHGVQLFVTLGSPLGLQMVRDRLKIVELAVPSWVNVRDARDPVAVAGPLSAWWPQIKDLIVDNGGDAHAAERYLGKRAVGQALLAALPRSALG